MEPARRQWRRVTFYETFTSLALTAVTLTALNLMHMMLRMRTTVTLENDVVEGVKSLARKRSISFKAALNEAVRAGLVAERGGPRPYRMPSRPIGFRPEVDITHALRLAADLEDEEIIRKMKLGK